MGTYPSGNKVTDQPQILFVRVDAEKMMEEVNALMESKKAAAKDASEETAEDEKEDEAVIDIEPKEEITYEDFSKMQFQVGEIISCEAVKKSKKASVLSGKDRISGKADCFRYQSSLHTRRNGWQEGYGSCKLKAGKACRCFI